MKRTSLPLHRRGFMTLLGATALGWPRAARAQDVMPVVGFLSSLSREGAVQLEASFQQGLRDEGYVNQQNVAIEYKWALGQYDRLPAMAAEFANSPVSVLVTVGGKPAALAAKSATSTIPIVFPVGSDPVKLGLVASYNRPGGNATGINMLTEALEPKRIGILRELLPHVSKLAVLVNPKFPPADAQSREIDEAARTFGMQTQHFRASTETEIETAFQWMAEQHLSALIVATDPVLREPS